MRLPTLAQREGATGVAWLTQGVRLWVTRWLVPAPLSSGFNRAIRSWLDLSGSSAGVDSGVTSDFSLGHQAAGQEKR